MKIVSFEQHINRIAEWFSNAMGRRYTRGQREHGGSLWLKPGALSNMEEEIIDTVVYYRTAKDQLRKMADEGATAREAYDFLYGDEHEGDLHRRSVQG